MVFKDGFVFRNPITEREKETVMPMIRKREKQAWAELCQAHAKFD
jgi:hypothetical protein